MEVIHEWKYIDFVPNDEEEASRDYTKFVPIDVDRWRSKVLFFFVEAVYILFSFCIFYFLFKITLLSRW